MAGLESRLAAGKGMGRVGRWEGRGEGAEGQGLGCGEGLEVRRRPGRDLDADGEEWGAGGGEERALA